MPDESKQNGTGEPAAETPKRKQEPTEYVMLQMSESGLWKKLDKTVKAPNVQAAISAVAADEGGTFVAVPARSWKPMALKVEQIAKRSFEEVSA